MDTVAPVVNHCRALESGKCRLFDGQSMLATCRLGNDCGNDSHGIPWYLSLEESFVDKDEYAVHHMGNGETIFHKQGYHRYPVLRILFPYTWERTYNVTDWSIMIERNWWFPVLVCTLYMLVVVIGGPRWMRARDAYSLRAPLAAWNLALAIFSIVGFTRVVPSVVGHIVQDGFDSSVCALPPARLKATWINKHNAHMCMYIVSVRIRTFWHRYI